MALRVLVIVSLATGAAAVGGCSADDTKQILDHYKTGDISFGSNDNDCTHSSWSVFSGFNKDSMVSCLKAKEGLSDTCGACFATHGEFAVANCKLNCLFSWCSDRCISCLKADHPALNKCTGFTYPHLESCKGPVVPDTTALMLDEVPANDDSELMLDEEPNTDDTELVAESSPSGISFTAAGLIGFFAGSAITFATHSVRRKAFAAGEEPLLLAA